jgi:phosphate transport system substrate-binding protein
MFAMKLRLGMIILFLLFVLGCSSTKQLTAPVVRIKGSDTMLSLARLWAEEYMKQHPGVSVYVEGGGSATGFGALIKGEIDICTASRPMRSQEARALAEKRGSLGLSFLAAKDALSIYVNPENPVRDLSLSQLKDIFTGKVRNWTLVGGKDQPILIMTRSPNSGTYLYFQEHVLEGEPYAPSAQIMPTTQVVINAVASNVNAIGYGGIAYEWPIVHCSVDGIAPSEENVIKGIYPIARYLYLYTRDTPRGYVKQVIDWVQSPPGQQVVRKARYFPIFPWEKRGTDREVIF